MKKIYGLLFTFLLTGICFFSVNVSKGFTPSMAIMPGLSVTASSNTPVCAGSALNLSSTVTGGTPAYSYLWSGPNSFSSTNANPTIASATTAYSGTYSVTVTDAATLTATATTTVTIKVCNHLTMSLQNCSQISATVLQFDLFVVSDGSPTSDLRANSFQYGINFNTGILQSGATITPSYVSGSSDFIPPLGNFSFPSSLFPDHIKITEDPFQGGNTGTTMIVGHQYKVGTFRFTASSTYATNSNPNFALQATSSSGRANCLSVVWIGNNSSTDNFLVNGTGDGQRSVSVSCSLLLNNCTISASASNTNVPCFGGSSGTATVSTSGGITPFSYLWSNGQTTQTATGLTSGNYTITVTDAITCTATASVTVTQPSSALNASSSLTTPIICHGGTGSVTVSASGGTTPYNGTGVFFVTAGSYNYTVTDSHGCAATTSITLTQPSALSISCSSTNVTCGAGNDGTVSTTVSGGTPGYTYLWNNGATTSSISGLTAGTYSVTVTDANGSGCTTTCSQATQVVGACNHITMSLQNCSQPSPDVIQFDLYVVSDGSAGSDLRANAFQYGINFNSGILQSGATITPSYITGTSDFIPPLTGFNFPPSTFSDHVRIVGNAYTGSNTGTTMTVGHQYKVGTFQLTSSAYWVNGSSPNFSLQDVAVTNKTTTAANVWIGNSVSPTSFSVTGTSDGQRSVFVSCSATLNVCSLTASASSTNVTCGGGSNGTASVTASGGWSPYQYLWSNGQTNSALTNLTAGTYTVTVLDLTNCSATASVTITQPPVLVAGTIIPSNYNGYNVSCQGSSNGTATVNPIGGTGSYNFLWSNGQTSAMATGLSANILYSVTVTDSHNCTDVSSITLTEPSALSAGTITSTLHNGYSISCNGGSNGDATANPSGGSGGNTYLWSNGQTTNPATSLSAGNYSVTITNNNGCSAVTSITLNEPSALSTSSSVISNVSCNGLSDGSVSVAASGGTAPYNGTGAFSGKSAGTYTFIVTDANGCTSSTSVTITQPSALTANSSVVSNVSCNGGNNGSAAVGATGGTSPYSGTGTFSGLTAGTYTYVVTDAHGCTTSTTISISQPAAALTASCSGTDVSCSNGSDGSVSVSAGGGTPSYSYLWSNGATTASVTNLAAATYSVTVTDAHGCTATCSHTVNACNHLTMSLQNCSQPTCNTIQFDLYVVSDGSATSDLRANAFQYGINFNTTTLQSGASITPSYVSGSSDFIPPLNGFFFPASGSVDHIRIVENPYSGSNTGTTMTVGHQYKVGTFILTSSSKWVANSNPNFVLQSVIASGKTVSAAVVWVGNAATPITISNSGTGNNERSVIVSCSLTLNPCNLSSSSSSSPVSCFGGSNGTATVSASGQCNPVFHYLWNNGQTTQTATGLSAGSYSVTVTDDIGCTTIATATVAQPSTALSASVSQNSPILCHGGSTTVSVSASGGTSPYNGTGTFSVTAGSFNFIVTDANGCTNTTSISISEPAALSLTTMATGVCSFASDGAASVSSSGGFSPYQYLWSNGQTTTTITGLSAGNYTITVTDINNCTATTSATVSSVTCVTVLNLKLFIEGYYLGSGVMQPVMLNEGVGGATSSQTDTITVDLHNPTSPYGLVESVKAILMTDGTASPNFSGTIAGHSYYIAVRHRNTIQTWSAAPVAFTPTTNVVFSPVTVYDFSTAITQAYFSNMTDEDYSTHEHDGIWRFYTGDINQDGNIDLLDFPALDNGIKNGLFGYQVTDLNGDSNVDLQDFPVYDTNLLNGVFSIRPH